MDNSPDSFGSAIHERVFLERWPEKGGRFMEFRLVLRGALPPHKRGTVDAKHRIRQEIHPQLRAFWQQHPYLAPRWKAEGSAKPLVEQYADDYASCGFRWIPLVTKDAACSLDILLLRRGEPHKVFSPTGDVDGRVKTLLDGLRKPQQCTEVTGLAPTADEDPFFVLMEDDSVIYEINVTTDRLFVPPEPQEPERDIVAIIHVKTRTFSGSRMNIHDSSAW